MKTHTNRDPIVATKVKFFDRFIKNTIVTARRLFRSCIGNQALVMFLRRAIGKIYRTATQPLEERKVNDAIRRFRNNRREADEYETYLRAQIRQTRAKIKKDASFRLLPFVSLFEKHCRDLSPQSAILCIGARNTVELDILERHGFHNVTAIDLWSSSPRIIVCDMHNMIFDDDTFDLIFASHAFEHSYDFNTVAQECLRVLKSGGYVFCAVPLGFAVNDHERIDFGNVKGLLNHFTPHRANILYQETKPGEMVLLFRIEKHRDKDPDEVSEKR